MPLTEQDRRLPAATRPAELPAIRLAPELWELPQDAVIRDQMLLIPGAAAEPRRARYATAYPAQGDRAFYFICEVRLTERQPEQAPPPTPTLRLHGSNDLRGQTTESVIIPRRQLGQWVPAAVLYRPPAERRSRELRVEITLPASAAVLEVRRPRLSWGLHGRPDDFTPTSIFPFPVPPTPVSTLDIQTAHRRPLPRELLGVNRISILGKSLIGPADPRVQTLVRQQPPASIRFPAGTMANWYNWRTDALELPDWESWSPRHRSTYEFLRRAARSGLKWGFEDYAALTRECRIAPVAVYNVLYDSPQDSAARLRRDLERGLRWAWIELGNENYMDMQRGVGNIKSVEDYLRISRDTAAALRQVDPHVRCAVVVPHYLRRDMREDGWAARLAAEDWYDGVVIHPYLSVPILYMTDREALKSIFGAYAHMRGTIDNCARFYPGKPQVVSEWGVTTKGWPGLDSFLQVIADAEQVFAVIRGWEEGKVAQASIHQYLGGGMGLYDLSPGPADAARFLRRPKGVLFEMLWEAFRGADIYDARAQGPSLADPDGDPLYADLPAINVRAARGVDGRIRVFCVNKLPCPARLRLTVDGVAPSLPIEHRVYAEDLRQEVGLHEAAAQPLDIRRSGTDVELPPYSVNLLVLPGT